MQRRQFLTVAGTTVLASAGFSEVTSVQERPYVKLSGRLKLSVARWCYGGISTDDLCNAAASMGYKSVELLEEPEWLIPKKYGITCAVAMGPGGIGKGWNHIENHDELVKRAEYLLPKAAEAGLPQMVLFSGNRAGISDADGLRNCATGLKRVAPLAEKVGVTMCMELLNSRVDHHDYQCDKTDWGVELCKAVASPRFKLLFDIYHVQIMEGDIIRRITDAKEYISHFHTGGVPGRAEIDDTQELYYPAICKAIVEMGFDGYLAQEFIPRRDPLASLYACGKICDV